MLRQQIIMGIVMMATCFACKTGPETKTIGNIERLDPALDSILSAEAKIEIIAEGFEWSEGPLWIEGQNMLLFSDIPKNTVYKWTDEKGTQPYLSPSGYTGSQPRGGEMGSNGLLLDDEGNLILCQHGDRRLAMMLAPLDVPKAEFVTIADNYNGKRLNSPNDAVFRNYDFYFTDPPYGLEKRMDDSLKEIPFQGVYRVPADGGISLLIDTLSRPNGILFSPDGKYLVVANSDPKKAVWYRYNVVETTSPEGTANMSVNSGKIIYDATELVGTQKGLPDGMAIDGKGNIFATGPGGVFIFNLEGKLLGKINLPDASSNTELTGDDKTLFVTNDMYVLRIKMRK